MSKLTLAAINQRDTNFWSKEALRTQMRASDPAILKIALQNMDSLRSLGFPINAILSFDYHSRLESHFWTMATASSD